MKNNKHTILFSNPLIDYNKSINYIKKALINDFPNEGELNKKFENKISNLLKSKNVISCTSGTSALYLALRALGIGIGDEVLVPNITYPATANSVLMTGAKPILIDVRERDLLIDPKSLEKQIKSKTKAIIPVHISGRGTNIFELKKIAKKYGIYLIEDAAEALFSAYKGSFYGTIGDVGCFSLAPNKIITTGQGGLICTNNSFINKKIRKLKDQGRLTKILGGSDYFTKEGYNFKFTDLQAGLGLSQLENINFRINKLREIYNFYTENIRQTENFKIFNFKSNELALWTDAYCNKRDLLFNYLFKRKIICRKFWYPLSFSKKNIKKKDLLTSCRIYKKLIWLPSALQLDKKSLKKICTEINTFNKKYN
jgi:perosamine synthetase